MVIAQEPTQSLAALHGAVMMNPCVTREQEDIALSLMIALGMIMFDEFVQRPPEGALAQKDHLGQALLLHRADPALRKGIQVGAARGQREWFNPT